MIIIPLNTETIKASEDYDGYDVDATATELLGLREFVVESYVIDEARQISRFHCGIHFDCGICPRCRNVGKDVHQYDKRSVRDVGCFERKVYLVFRIRRFLCPKCHKVFTESLDSIATYQRCTRRFQQMVYQECLGQTFLHVAKKLGMN